jgi:hypothetical protein
MYSKTLESFEILNGLLGLNRDLYLELIKAMHFGKDENVRNV